MNARVPDGADHGKTKDTPHLDINLQVQVLLAEYNRLSAEIKMFIEQFSPKFSLFGVFVLSAFAFAFNNHDYPVVFAIIPFFIYLLGLVTIAQAHVIAVQAGRIRAIERKVNLLNAGEALLEWESKIAPKFVYPPLVSIPFRGKSRHKRRMLSPIFISVLFLLLSMVPLLAYSTIRAYAVIRRPWNWLYAAFVCFCFIASVMQSFTFFRVGGLSSEVEFETNETT